VSDKSAIEWTDATWNPVRGCHKISPGCGHCYAETFAERFRGVAGHPYEQGFDPRIVPDKLDEPMRWKKPRRIFVNSMSDLFLHEFPDSYIEQCCATMQLASHHTYQVLTKRAERLVSFLAAHPHFATLPHVLWGVSVENKKHGLPRLEALRRSNATWKMLSVEPLLEDLGDVEFNGYGWVIVGGESGHGARPMHPDWVRSIRDQAVAANVPFFFKQFGAWFPRSEWEDNPDLVLPDDSSPDGPKQRTISGDVFHLVGKHAAGRVLDGRTWDEQPEIG
jgi:protein gp37